MSPLPIRRAGPDDGAALSAYAAALMAEGLDTIGRLDPPPTTEQEQAWLAGMGPHGFALIAMDGPRVAGLADLRIGPVNAHRTPSAAFGMSVARTWRGRGVGRALLERLVVETEACPLGIVRLELDVVAWNAPAIALYESLGFAHEGRRRHAVVDRTGARGDLLMMARLL